MEHWEVNTFGDKGVKITLLHNDLERFGPPIAPHTLIITRTERPENVMNLYCKLCYMLFNLENLFEIIMRTEARDSINLYDIGSMS